MARCGCLRWPGAQHFLRQLEVSVLSLQPVGVTMVMQTVLLRPQPLVELAQMPLGSAEDMTLEVETEVAASILGLEAEHRKLPVATDLGR